MGIPRLAFFIIRQSKLSRAQTFGNEKTSQIFCWDIRLFTEGIAIRFNDFLATILQFKLPVAISLIMIKTIANVTKVRKLFKLEINPYLATIRSSQPITLFQRTCNLNMNSGSKPSTPTSSAFFGTSLPQQIWLYTIRFDLPFHL